MDINLLQGFGVAVGSGVYTVTGLSVRLAVYQVGFYFLEIPTTNSGAGTINIDSLGVKDLKDKDGSAFVGNEIPTGVQVWYYTGTEFRFQGEKSLEKFAVIVSPGGAHSLTDSDSGKHIEITAGLTIPTGLKVGAQFSIGLTNGTKQTLTTAGITIRGSNSSFANISRHGSISIVIVAVDVARIVGETEA